MAGFATSLVQNIYPAQFGQIARNIVGLQADAAHAFASERFRADLLTRQTSVDTEDMKPSADRDADGHDWGPPMRRKRKALPLRHNLEVLAGEGSLFDIRT